jgi:sulfite reductase (NADPH) flavoprotein alpha-component
MSNLVPVIPENAPFTAEQRAYLNGFLAGLFSRASATLSGFPSPSGRGARGEGQTSSVSPQPLSIVYGSQTGNAESLAKRAANEARKHGFVPAVHDLANFSAAQLAAERHLLVITSTYGDGDPPDNAKPFWELIRNGTAPTINELRFAVLALGDSSYPRFCAFGKNVDERLAALGGHRAHPRLDCDVEFEQPFKDWITVALNGLAGALPLTPRFSGVPADLTRDKTVSTVSQLPSTLNPQPSTTAYGRGNPFPAQLLTNRRLNGPGSAKDTRHFELSLEGSGLEYQVGDALAVRPCNCRDLVAEILDTLGYSGDEALRDALLRDYEINRIPPALLKAIAEKSDAVSLTPRFSGVEANVMTDKTVSTVSQSPHDILDLLRQYPNAKFSSAEFVALLKKLQPRLYSISSSPKAHPGQVHLCVAAVRYEAAGRARKGVCSTFLADRVPLSTTVPVFVHHNKNFRPPADPATPMIMVGPGTGIAPFRAFLEERRAIGAKGKNWLFFGDQHAATDFLYADEIETMLRDGTLTRLDTAFSRDQPEKIYVQQRILENARELFAWLENGAHFYVCGDAKRMAKDVDHALHHIIEIGGTRTPDQAADYVRSLTSSKRYQRDVY